MLFGFALSELGRLNFVHIPVNTMNNRLEETLKLKWSTLHTEYFRWLYCTNIKYVELIMVIIIFLEYRMWNYNYSSRKSKARKTAVPKESFIAMTVLFSHVNFEMVDPVTSGDLCSPRHDVPDVHLLALIAGQIIVQRSTARILCGGETWICSSSLTMWCLTETGHIRKVRVRILKTTCIYPNCNS